MQRHSQTNKKNTKSNTQKPDFFFVMLFKQLDFVIANCACYVLWSTLLVSAILTASKSINQNSTTSKDRAIQSYEKAHTSRKSAYITPM